MKWLALYIFLLLICLKGFGQFYDVTRFPLAAAYEENTPMKKVFVCADDQSVWALSEAGRVYYKRQADAGFTEFSGLSSVTDLSGYSWDAMYFVLNSNTLYYWDNTGAARQIQVGQGTVVINQIAAVKGSTNAFVEGFQGKRDWLAIATDTYLYALNRDAVPQDPFRYGPVTGAIGSEGWRITNSGYKSLDLQYRHSSADTCFGDVDHAFYSPVKPKATVLPEMSPAYSSQINCTYFENVYNVARDGPAKVLDIWGTDGGLFAKKANACDLGAVNKLLDVKINDLEELNLFRDVINLKLLLVAADDGVYTGYISVDDPDIVRMDRLFGYDGKVSSIALEVEAYDQQSAGNGVLCQGAVWLATANGIRQMAVTPPKVNISPTSLFRYPELVTVSGGLLDNYPICNGQTYTFTVHFPDNNRAGYRVEWHTDPEFYAQRKEIVALRGQTTVTLDSRGEYGIRLISGCGEIIDIGSFWLRLPQLIEPEFDYPPVLNIYEGCSFTFTAKAGNKYRWEKDGEIIPGETSNILTTTMPGVYKLQYQDCSNNFISSEPVELKTVPVVTPVIERSSSKSLCFGETVTLTAPEVAGATYKWYPDGETTRSIMAGKTGNYYVDVILGDNCFKRSATVKVEVDPEIALAALPQAQICTLRQQTLRLTAQEGFESYSWDGVPGNLNYLDVTAPGEYALEVTDAGGCKASTVYVVVPYCPALIPPNAFSPNGDGQNDVWKIEGLEDHPEAALKIYNRYGMKVYDQSGTVLQWDGRYDGKDAAAGVYYYVLTKKGEQAMTGSLALIR